MRPESWKITAWALDELDGPDADEVAAAIADDPTVADEVEAIMASAAYTKRELGRLPPELLRPPTASAPERTTTGPVGAVVELEPRRKRAWRWAAAAGVGLAAAVALILALNKDEPVTPPTPSPLAVAPETHPAPVTGRGAGDPSVAGEDVERSERGADEALAEGPGESSSAPGASPETLADDHDGATPTAALTIIVDPPSATLMASRGRIEVRGRGLYLLRDLAKGEVVKVRVEGADGRGVSREVLVDEGEEVVRIAIVEAELAPPHDSSRAEPGSLRVNARPWARVELDGEQVGVTPLTLSVKPGRHTLKLTRGQQTHTQVVVVEAGERRVVYQDLGDPAPEPTPAPVPGAKGQLSITARPWAQIAVDGRPVGTTPKTLPLSPGRHVVTLTKGSRRFDKVITVESGRKATIFHDFTDNPF